MAKETCSVCGKGLNVFNKAARKDDEIMCFQCSDAAKKADKQAEKERKAEEKAKAKEKPICAICEKEVGKITKVKLKDGEIICNDCYCEAIPIKEQIKRREKNITLKEVQERYEIAKEKRENKPEIEPVTESKLYKFGERMEKLGESIGRKGDALTKAGLHTTAAVWTPALYLGYRAVKKNGKNESKENPASANSTPEQDLIKLIQECEQAHKDGKIDEETMKEYIVDFTNKYYRM